MDPMHTYWAVPAASGSDPNTFDFTNFDLNVPDLLRLERPSGSRDLDKEPAAKKRPRMVHANHAALGQCDICRKRRVKVS